MTPTIVAFNEARIAKQGLLSAAAALTDEDMDAMRSGAAGGIGKMLYPGAVQCRKLLAEQAAEPAE